MQIQTVIAKPTRLCNANCAYCAAPPDGEGMWDLSMFRMIFDRLAPSLHPSATWVWHGGEPMMLGPKFYRAAAEYAHSKIPLLQFGMQSNLLLYQRDKWDALFKEVFHGRLSTSYDPDDRYRTLNGCSASYRDKFFTRLRSVLDDGYRPLVIGTYSEDTMALCMEMYDLSMSYGDQAFPIRMNYRYPAGRASGGGVSIDPSTYGQWLVRLYDRWIQDVPNFTITPLDQMLRKVIGLESDRCPWTRSCGGRFVSIEPNGDVFQCGEYADLGGNEYRFGNLRAQNMGEIMQSQAAVLIRRRRTVLPTDCLSCRHFQECEGGCSRDSALFGNGVLGKFYYCESWMMVFDRIKESIRCGEADRALAMFGVDPVSVRLRMAA